MKKLLPLLCAMCLILTSCSYEEVSPGSGADTDSGTIANPETSTEPEDPPDTKDSAESETAADTTESEPVPDETVGHLPEPEPVTDEADAHFSSEGNEQEYGEAAKLLTAEDIFLLSFNCGYVSDIRSDKLIIETEKQLDVAMREYGSMISDLLGETVKEYPIDGYSYVVEYVEVGSGGFDLKAGALLIDADTLSFVQSADSVTPDLSSVQTAVMDGFCYMAVVPKGTLMNGHYENWTYPESEALLQ